MSTSLQPWFECKNNLLRVTWPTDDVFPEYVKEIPDVFTTRLTKLFNAFQPPYGPELSILTHIPP